MSYTDDEEVKIGDMSEDEDDMDLDDPIDPVDDDLVATDDEDDEEVESFAGLDGAEY